MKNYNNNFSLSVTLENVRRVKMQFNDLDDFELIKQLALKEFGLDHITNESDESEIKRYNKFVQIWNTELHKSVEPLEMTKLKKECQELLRETKAELAEVKRDAAESKRELAEVKRDSLDRAREAAETKRELAELRESFNNQFAKK